MDYLLTACSLLSLLSGAIIQTTSAQEYPISGINNFDTGINLRTNVCSIQQSIYNDEVRLPDALNGVKLSVVLVDYPQEPDSSFFTLSDQGTIKESQPGILVDILDEVASRAGFTWRESFAAVAPLEDGSNTTWTDMLLWQTENFDISMGYWTRSLTRLAQEVAFAEGWYDSSIVIVERNTKSSDKGTFDMFNFLTPFTRNVWLLICASIILSGMCYWILEWLNEDADEKLQLSDKPLHSIYLASLVFVGHNEYKPTTHSARMLSFSWSFWAVLVVSAYTANLANFLVSKSADRFTLTSFHDAVAHNIPVCVAQGTAQHEFLKSRYPDLWLVPKLYDSECFAAMRDGECMASAIEHSTYKTHQRSQISNDDCALTYDGRLHHVFPSGMATAVDTAQYCTSLINHVLDYHLVQMKIDGYIDQAWERHVDRVGTHACVDTSLPSQSLLGPEDDTTALGLREMGGIFIFHGILSFVAVVFAIFQYFILQKKTSAEFRDKMRSSWTGDVTSKELDRGDGICIDDTANEASSTSQFRIPVGSDKRDSDSYAF